MSKERPRRAVHVCNLCNAIWDGSTAPPPQCPNCGGGTGWADAEVGDQPGMVGGRLFKPGTNVPLTRVFLCRSCSGMTVVRHGGAVPATCPKCGADGAQLTEAMTEKKKPAPPNATVGGYAVEHAVPVPPPRVEVRQPVMEPPRGITADDYRLEWVAERVAAWSDHGGLERAVAHDLSSQIWASTAALYDAGREAGFLP